MEQAKYEYIRVTPAESDEIFGNPPGTTSDAVWCNVRKDVYEEYQMKKEEADK